MPELLARDACEPSGLQAVCNQARHQAYQECHAHCYESCELHCVQRDVTPPEGSIHHIKVGVGEVMGEWYCTAENATLADI
eukprot:COSAG02_NODE_12909_length_1473_cov_3.029840_3_plen_80_part_01